MTAEGPRGSTPATLLHHLSGLGQGSGNGAKVAGMSELVFRTCPLCEATCGLEIEVKDDGGIGRIRGDRDDVFSHGFICPKGSTLKQLHEDPDRLHTPMVRGDDGGLHAATWDEIAVGRVLRHEEPPRGRK